MGQLRQHLARPRLEPHRPDGQVRHQVRHHPVRFNASVENATNKNYWIGMFGDGFVMPGAPRTFRVSGTVSF